VERNLQLLNWMKVRELVPASIDTVIFAVGTVEAHGSGCLGTDNLIPEMIANGIAERLNALVAPTVNYGVTKSLARFNGSSYIRPETLQAYVHEVLDSLADAGFHNVILLNGHGGNNTPLKNAAFEFHAARKVNIAVIHWWELCADMTKEFFGHPGGHAGTDEAAMMQAVDFSLVDRKSYDPEHAYYFQPGADIYPVPGTILLYTPDQGYPEFDEAKAKRYHDKVIGTVGDFAEMVLGRWRKFGL
jgi:creatinine amidohydrolase